MNSTTEHPPAKNGRRFPAEWEPHSATWLAWPHQEHDWPGKFEAIAWVYVEIVRHLAPSEQVEIICSTSTAAEGARLALEKSNVPLTNVQFHVQPTDRSWLRDSAPTLVKNNGHNEWIQWCFNGWAKYDNYNLDRQVPPYIGKVTNLPVVAASRLDPSSSGATRPFVLEGGAIESDGAGTLLVTEECLLSPIQDRNPGLVRAGYEQVFREYLGITKTIWLKRGCVGDDTHGHIDDLSRFVAPGVVVTALESDRNDENYAALRENCDILESSSDSAGRPLKVIPLPMPEPIYFDGVRLPASYANFYIANKCVLVPTFNDPHDREVLAKLGSLFPDRKVVGIHAVDLVWGFGTLHCLSQQQPR